MKKIIKVLLFFSLITLASKCFAYDHSIFLQAELPGYDAWLLGYNHLLLSRRLTISVDAGGRVLTPAWLTEVSAHIHYNISDLYYAGLGNTFMVGDMDANGDHSYMVSFAEPQTGVHIGQGDRISIFTEVGYMWLYKKWTPENEKDVNQDILIPTYVTAKVGFEYWL